MQLNKIHLACGNNLFNGWENYDYFPTNGAGHIDLLQPLPFENNSVDYIYFEHALEHFDEVDGFKLMKEINRVLKLKGTIRIVTPSLDTYINRYLNWKDDINNNHRQIFHNETQFLNYAFFGENVNDDIKFLNNLKSQQVGHKFLYSTKNLINKLNDLGFNSEICEYKVSKHSHLHNLETRPDYKDLIIEATKNG